MAVFDLESPRGTPSSMDISARTSLFGHPFFARREYKSGDGETIERELNRPRPREGGGTGGEENYDNPRTRCPPSPRLVSCLDSARLDSTRLGAVWTTGRPTPGNILLKVAGDGQRGTQRWPHGEGRGRVDVDDNVARVYERVSTSSSHPGGGGPGILVKVAGQRKTRERQEGQRQARRHDNAGWPRAPAASSMTRCSVCVRAGRRRDARPVSFPPTAALLLQSWLPARRLSCSLLLALLPPPVRRSRPCFAARAPSPSQPARISQEAEMIGGEERNEEGEG